uniref:Uncharacterized protein n=1 Tax=Cynoglossus semilaevis TaxID=244447 RepID=A0A3P8ULY2_CYNSE
MADVELSCRVYVKMYLHACLFPHCPVVVSSDPPWVTVWTLFQVDVWCSQTQQRIVGYYQANACVSDSR